MISSLKIMDAASYDMSFVRYLDSQLSLFYTVLPFSFLMWQICVNVYGCAVEVVTGSEKFWQLSKGRVGALSAGSAVGHDLEAGYWRVSAFSAEGASSDALKQHQQNVPSSRRAYFCWGGNNKHYKVSKLLYLYTTLAWDTGQEHTSWLGLFACFCLFLCFQQAFVFENSLGKTVILSLNNIQQPFQVRSWNFQVYRNSTSRKQESSPV